MALNFTIPAAQYRDAQPVQVPHLTDTEREALSYAYLDKQFDVRAYEDMAGKERDGTKIISGWRDATDAHDMWRIGMLREAMLSLDRLGLVDSRYDHGDGRPSRERVIGTDWRGNMLLPENGWRYKLNDLGEQVMALCRARIYVCCPGAVAINCVCMEKTFCAEHGGGCHGTHD